MEWKANYLNPSEVGPSYGDFSSQEILGISYVSALRTQITTIGLTFLAAFDGRHRSGKSIAATTLAYLWDPTFWPNYENRMVQEPKQFMDCLERIEQEKIHGAVIQVDEAGVSMASSEWYERWMKTLTKTIQMFGYLHPVVFFVAPNKDFMDSRIRKMFHAYYSVSRSTNDFSVLTPYNVFFSTIKSKWYYKKPVVKLAGQNIKLERIRLGKPPAFILDRYSEYEKGIKARMLGGFIADMRKDEFEDVKKKKDLKAIILKVVENPEVFKTRTCKHDNWVFDKTIIQYQFDCSTNESMYVKSQAERVINSKNKEIKEAMMDSGIEPVTPGTKPKGRKIDGLGKSVMGTNSGVFG